MKFTDLRNKFDKYDYIFMVCLLVLSIFSLWRVKYGFVETDEQGILAFAYAFSKGDRPIIDNWHPAHLWAVLVTPFMWTYGAFHNSFEGIYLFLRHFFVFFHMLAMISVYYILQKHSKPAAIIASIMFAFYAPFGINSFGYNICGLWSIIFLLALFRDERAVLEEKTEIIRYILAGMIIAALVLCNPYCVFLYLFQMIYWIIKWKEAGKVYLWKIIFIHAGIAILCVYFLILVYRGGSLYEFAKEIKHNFPMMMSDGTHGSKKLSDIVYPVTVIFQECFWAPTLYLAFLIAGYIDRKRRQIYMALVLIDGVAFFVFLLSHMYWLGTMGLYLVQAPVGIVAYIWLEKKPKRLFVSGFMLSIAYAFLLNYSSNNGLMIVIHGLTVASVISVLFVYLYICQLKGGNRATFVLEKSLVSCLALGILLCCGYYKLTSNFWEDNTFELNSVITCGPQKGIHTTEEKKTLNEQQTKEIQNITAGENDSILFFCKKSEGYLMTEAKVGSFSTYCYEEQNLETDAFNKYYAVHPDRIPNIVYVDSESKGRQGDDYWYGYCENNGYNLEALPSGAYLLTRN